MAPLEIKPGKRPARIKPAEVYPARDPKFPHSPARPFPLKGSFKRELPTIHRQATVLQGSNDSLHLAPASLTQPPMQSLPSELVPENELTSIAIRHPLLSMLGERFPSQRSVSRKTPPPLPRAYKLGVDEGHLHALDVPGPIHRLKPLLAPSVLNQESADLFLPSKAMDHQVEAINAFLKNDAFLLADDPGMGKTTSVCLAIAAKMQAGQAHRVLMVCSEGSLRNTAQTLVDWVPGLSLTVVRGGAEQRRLDWNTPAHVYLVDLPSLKVDLEKEILAGSDLEFDILVLDDISMSGLRFQSFPGLLARIQAPVKWVLSGGLPTQAEDWIQLFGFLLPDQVQGTAGITTPDLQRRFKPYLLRREKAATRESLPQRSREFRWVDLDAEHFKLYEEALAEERHKLAQLGEAISPAHIESSIATLKAVSNFEGPSLDGGKVRALVPLVEQIVANDSKVIILSQFQARGLERLQPVLEPYGVLWLSKDASEEERRTILQSFRAQTHWHVLLLESGARMDGESLVEASYIIHFDHAWNPALRMRAELRLHPAIFRAIPITIYEFWVADTIDQALFRLLADKNLLPTAIAEGTQPKDLEGRIKLEEWLDEVLQIQPAIEDGARIGIEHPVGTGILPGTSVLRDRLAEISSDTLMAGVETLMKALGYTGSELIDEAGEEPGYLLAWRDGEQGVERVLVRCIQSPDNVGIAAGRSLLKAMEARNDCVGAYLMSTADFTSACRKLADESDGRLALVSGAELYRHLHILGRF